MISAEEQTRMIEELTQIAIAQDLHKADEHFAQQVRAMSSVGHSLGRLREMSIKSSYQLNFIQAQRKAKGLVPLDEQIDNGADWGVRRSA